MDFRLSSSDSLAASSFVSLNEVLLKIRPAFVITCKITPRLFEITLTDSCHFTPLILIVIVNIQDNITARIADVTQVLPVLVGKSRRSLSFPIF